MFFVFFLFFVPRAWLGFWFEGSWKIGRFRTNAFLSLEKLTFMEDLVSGDSERQQSYSGVSGGESRLMKARR